ncbi:hypothetical protein QUF80_03830 [Desulfococcaceae bacterium HSG8]|nr:hypothetical protein [Desulfococcaceae bacterium HSG8]
MHFLTSLGVTRLKPASSFLVLTDFVFDSDSSYIPGGFHVNIGIEPYSLDGAVYLICKSETDYRLHGMNN